MSQFNKWANKISAARREAWRRIECQPQPDGRIAYYRKRQMIWFVGDEIVVDGSTFAACYNLPDDRPNIVKEIHRMIGKVHIVWSK